MHNGITALHEFKRKTKKKKVEVFLEIHYGHISIFLELSIYMFNRSSSLLWPRKLKFDVCLNSHL